MKPGVNRIEAVAYRAGQPVATDSCGWNYRADGTPLPNQMIADQDAANAGKKTDAASQPKATP